MLRAEDYAPVLAGHHRDKLDRLAALGLEVKLEDHLDPGFDVVIDCTGNSAGLNRALALVRPRGTVILKSTAAASASLNLAQAVVNEITIVGSRCGRFAPAIAALASGKDRSAPAGLEHLPARRRGGRLRRRRTLAKLQGFA